MEPLNTMNQSIKISFSQQFSCLNHGEQKGEVIRTKKEEKLFFIIQSLLITSWMFAFKPYYQNKFDIMVPLFHELHLKLVTFYY